MRPYLSITNVACSLSPDKAGMDVVRSNLVQYLLAMEFASHIEKLHGHPAPFIFQSPVYLPQNQPGLTERASRRDL